MGQLVTKLLVSRESPLPPCNIGLAIKPRPEARTYFFFFKERSFFVSKSLSWKGITKTEENSDLSVCILSLLSPQTLSIRKMQRLHTVTRRAGVAASALPASAVTLAAKTLVVAGASKGSRKPANTPQHAQHATACTRSAVWQQLPHGTPSARAFSAEVTTKEAEPKPPIEVTIEKVFKAATPVHLPPHCCRPLQLALAAKLVYTLKAPYCPKRVAEPQTVANFMNEPYCFGCHHGGEHIRDLLSFPLGC